MFLVSVSLYRVCIGSFLCMWSLFLCLGVLGLCASFLVFWCFGFFFRCVCVLVSMCAVCWWSCVCLWVGVLVSYVAGLVWGCVSACGVLVVGLFGVRVSLGCSVYVSGLLIVWCVPYVCAPLLGVLGVLCVVWCLYWFVVLGVLVVGLCLCGCGGFRGLGVCCFLFLGFAWFCFLVGCWGFVFWWVVACWFGWWFVFVGCLGGFCVLGVDGCVLFFWSYIICVDCGGALRVSACVGFLFGVTACFLGVCS